MGSSASRSSISTCITATAPRTFSGTIRTSCTPRPTRCRSIPAPARDGERGEHDQIVNAPLRAGDGGDAFREAFDVAILPRVDEFGPDLVIISAGFDAHRRDPLGNLNLVEADFAWVTRKLMEIAQKRCGGRIVSLLEGGYDLEGLGRSVGRACRGADGRLSRGSTERVFIGKPVPACSRRAQPSIGSTAAISMPKPDRPTYLRGLSVRRRIEDTPRSRRIWAPRPISRHCVARAPSEPGRLRADEIGRHAGRAVAQIDEHAAPFRP